MSISQSGNRCPKTGRLYEVGSGSLPREQQTASFVREAESTADMPRYETDKEARQRVRLEMQRQGASAAEITDALAEVVGGPEICPQTGRPFTCGSGCLPKSAQTRQFLEELWPAEKAQRSAAAHALNDVQPLGSA
jgi:hypothetical protein